VVGELGRLRPMGEVVFRGHQQPGGVPVDAMDDAGAQLAS
jgi:hypothetical protein